MGTVEDEIKQLYGDLKGETFYGECTNIWESEYSKEPQQRDVIETSQVGPKLDEKLSVIHQKLEGKVWKGFIPNRGGGWKFYVNLVGKNIGATGQWTIRDFEVFPITELGYKYTSRRGVSITITMNK